MRADPLLDPSTAGRGRPAKASARGGVFGGAPRRRLLASINATMAWRSLRAAARLLAARKLDLRTEGLQHIPAEGPVLLAVRHYHHLYDGVVLLDAVPRQLHMLVALDWVDGPRLRGLMEWATRTARWPTVLRTEGLAPDAAGDVAHARSAFAADEIAWHRLRGMRGCVDLLCEGAALAMFPEGFPNVDPRFTPKRAANEFLPFRSGFVAAVALAERRCRRRIPIVPVGLAYEAGARTRVRLRCGAPLHLEGRRADFIRTVQRRVEALSA